MKVHPKIPAFFFYGLIVLMVAVSAISFVNALSWVNKPFGGFLIYHPPYVGSMSIRDWPGRLAGLKFLEEVVSIDGEPVIRGRDVVSRVAKKEPGTLVRYVIKSKGTTREVTLPVTLFGFRDFFLTFFINLLGGLGVFCLGCIVYVLKPRVSTSWVFFLFSFFLGFYMITSFEILSTYVLVHLHYFAVCFMGITALHLGLIFPDRKRFLSRFPQLEYLIYALPLVLAIVYQIYFFTFPENMSSNLLSSVVGYRSLGTTARVITFSSAIGLIILMIHSLYRASSVTARQRARMILFGVTIAFLPSTAIMMGFYLFKVIFPWNFLVIFVIFFPASIAYSIVRHNLFDSDAIIKRTVGYVVVTGVIVGAYVLVSIFFNVFLGQYQVSQSKAFPIIFTLIIILIFNPLRNRIQSLVDRIFFRKEYNYGEIIDRISNAITSLLDLGQILKQMVRTFMEDMFINTSSVMLLNPAKTEYQVYLADGERRSEIEKVILKKDEPLIQIIEKEKKELTKYDVLEDPKYRTVCEGCTRNFETLNSNLMVPLVLRDEVIGVINLGEKKSGKSYNREDIDLLRTLANQGAVAIENARLVDQMKSEEAVRASLARYLSPQIVDQVIKKNVQVNLGGDRKVVTVLFSDIRNFTRISESLPPDKLVELLNEYFTEMARIIFENQGSLDKYIGDAIVAVFGSLIPLESPGRTAVQAAIQMMKEMSSLNERWKNRYGFRMEIGIGINTGEVFLGNVGSPERMEFTVIGDTVNIASRFSDVAKAGQILITKETLSNLGPEIKYTELPPLEVKGKTGKLEVFEILY
jgi:adenylate cyclase